MDESKRYITKISREAQRYANLSLKGTDIGATEFECLQFVRKHSGISQETLRNSLNVDKSAVTRMVANLEKKGYLYRLQDEVDRRAKKLYATERVSEIKNLAVSKEAFFYEWLLEELSENDKESFLRILDKLYEKSKMERRAQFVNLLEREEEADVRNNKNQPDETTGQNH